MRAAVTFVVLLLHGASQPVERTYGCQMSDGPFRSFGSTSEARVRSPAWGGDKACPNGKIVFVEIALEEMAALFVLVSSICFVVFSLTR